MPANFPEPADRRSSLSTRPISTGRTGLILGLIVALAMLAAFAFFWRAMDAPDTGEGSPAPAAADTLP